MSMSPGDANQLQRALAQSVREHWVLFLIEGIVLVVLGILAIVVPPLATIAFTLFLGWLFLISGIVGLFTTFWARQAPGFWWSLFSAVLAFQMGDGFTNMIIPTSAVLMGALTLAGVPWPKWARWVLPLQLGLFLLGLVVLAVATAVGYGA